MFLLRNSKCLVFESNQIIRKRFFKASLVSYKSDISTTDVDNYDSNPTFVDTLGNKYTPPNISKYVTKKYYPDNLPRSLKKEIDEYLVSYRMVNNPDWRNLTPLEQRKLYFLEYGNIGIRDPSAKMTKEAYIYKLIFQILLIITIITAASQLYKDKKHAKEHDNNIQ